MIWDNDEPVKRDNGSRRVLLIACLLSASLVALIGYAIWRWLGCPL